MTPTIGLAFGIAALCLLAQVCVAAEPPAGSAGERPFGVDVRRPWTTSRIQGSPDPPLPYRAERYYTKIDFVEPVVMTRAPDSIQPYVVERTGKIFRVAADPTSEQKELVLDGASQIEGLTAIYGLTFHPRFEENRLCYLCYILEQGLPEGTIVSRFRVTDTDPPQILAASEVKLLRWRSGGHNGGCLKFGRDGYLYISTGDGSAPSPPDSLNTGQDISDLLGSILRIDVDRQQDGLEYAIPPDNPFLEVDGARGEVWAYGLRNPWRMTFDRATNQLWLGDVGWQLWEMVHRIQRGGNYGWSVMEGPQTVRLEAQRGPTPIIPPMAAHPRSDAASVTGGYVYHGTRLPELSGSYIYGDYVTGKLWALCPVRSSSHDAAALSHADTKQNIAGQDDAGQDDAGQDVAGPRLLANTPLMIITFYEDHHGEILLLDYTTGTIHRIAANQSDQLDRGHSFPRKLSETGLFASVSEHRPAPGVIPFSINAEQWSDLASAERLVAIPGAGTITLNEPKERVPTDWGEFPPDTVLAKTISLEMQRGDPASSRRIETQILHFRNQPWRGNSGEWSGYTYVWNDDQTDATLAPREGLDLQFTITDSHAPGGQRQQTWRVSGQGECYQCHNPWTGYRLAFTVGQLNRRHASAHASDNQLRTLRHLDVVRTRPGVSEEALVDPYDKGSDLAERARSYLHVNCAHCHRFGGGGTATIDLRFEVPLPDTKMVGIRPTQGTFNIHRPQIVAAGSPNRSLLYYRMAKLGPGRMPHIGSHYVDQAGLEMIAQWIHLLGIRSLGDRGELANANPTPSRDAGFFGLETQHAEPSDLDKAKVDRLLSTTTGALSLMQTLDAGQINGGLVDQVLASASASPHSHIRDLFERFLPEDKRTKRLGGAVHPEKIRAKIRAHQGDAARGAKLFFEVAGVQCKNCHRIGEAGKNLGPDLTQIGSKRTAEQLLESVIAPSRTIDPKYVTYLVETTDGQVLSGLLAERTDEHIVLKDAQIEPHQVELSSIEQFVPQAKSLMPELLYRDLTAQQLADLLTYLKSLQ